MRKNKKKKYIGLGIAVSDRVVHTAVSNGQ